MNPDLFLLAIGIVALIFWCLTMDWGERAIQRFVKRLRGNRRV